VKPPLEGRGEQPLRVLVVDDSAVVRQAMRAILGDRAGMDVVAAADPLIAITKMARWRPDVMVLDLEMPRMDGLSFLRKVMGEDPLPVVICSGFAARGTEAAVRAIEEGAVAIVAKPRLDVRGFLEEAAVTLEETVRGAAAARLRHRGPMVTPRPWARKPRPGAAGARSFPAGSERLVAIGASTGGTEAIREILQGMPPGCPGLVVVQHIPEVFSRAFADRLNTLCAIEVKEAADGDRVLPGRALVAPGNRHTSVIRHGDGFAVQVKDGPFVSRHRPSVDVLFESVAVAAGERAIGVILTGMGQDGAQGLLDMRRAGAVTLAQNEATCVVFGMPREAIVRGAVDHVLALPRIADFLLEQASATARDGRC
jgi:two-component system chemotaxis response regulator CheB